MGRVSKNVWQDNHNALDKIAPPDIHHNSGLDKLSLEKLKVSDTIDSMCSESAQ